MTEVCPASGIPCETASYINRSLPFEGCPGQIVVIAFNSIRRETSAGPDGNTRQSFDVGARVQPFVICGINAVERTVAERVLSTPTGERARNVTLNEVRQTAANLVLEHFELPEDTIGLHSTGVAKPEDGSDILVIDEDAFQALQMEA